ncbi:MAG: class C sortase [Atopobiaceae bacterium]
MRNPSKPVASKEGSSSSLPNAKRSGRAADQRGTKGGRHFRVRDYLPEILLTCALLVGVGIMLYPTISDWWNDMHQSQAIATYQKAVEDNSAQKNQQMWDDAVAYNASLPHDNSRFTLSAEQEQQYDSLLDVTGTGIMGYVEIPKINVELPIYHGTDSSILQVAIGHIPGSSLPVGGEGTHCVISGHRGLPSARLFTDIDQLAEGDLFTLNVLGQTLTYQVDQIRIVLPDQLDDLAIDDGMDLCTLVTCTPYGVNTHRLLVRGHRVANESVAAIDGDATRVNPVLVAAVLTGVTVVVVLVVWAVRRRRAGMPTSFR